MQISYLVRQTILTCKKTVPFSTELYDFLIILVKQVPHLLHCSYRPDSHHCKALSMRSRGSFVLSSFCGFVIDHNAIKMLFSSWLPVFEHHFLIAGLKHFGSKKEISLKICFVQLHCGTKS